MAVTKVVPIAQGRSGTWGRDYSRTYTRPYRVYCDNRRDAEMTIRATTNGAGQPKLPVVGNHYDDPASVGHAEQDVGAGVVGIRYDFEKATPAGCTWIVTVEFGPWDGPTFGPNPVTWPLKAVLTEQKNEKIVWRDQAGNPIVNSAGARFLDPVTVDETRSILTCTRNEVSSTFNYTLAETFRDTTNADAWNGYAARTVKCASITTSDPQWDSNAAVYYLVVTYVFEINRDTWDRVILDQGYTRLSLLDSTKVYKIKDEDQQPKAEPSLLDGAGQPVKPGSPAAYKTFVVLPTTDFALLNIDLSTRLGA